MKQLLVGLALSLIPVSGLAAGKSIQVTVNGMVCAFCAQGVTKGLGEKDAVQNVDVDLKNKKVVVHLKDGKTLSDAEVKSVIEDAGFAVERIERP